MATQKKIGAVIGIEGAQKYTSDLSVIVRYTKELKSEMSALTSSFDDNTKTYKQVSQQREALNKVIEQLNEKLYQQKKVLEQVNNAAGDANVKDKDWLEVQTDLQTQINRTTEEINKYQKEIDNLPGKLELVTNAFKNANNEWTRQGELMVSVGGTLTKYVTAPLAALSGAGLAFATEWETAFTGVKKTVEGTPEELDLVAQGIKNIALNSASSVEEIAGVAEVAGQLGIATEDIVDFTRVMVMLGDSTNLSAEEAATALARVLNITGESTDNIDRIGAAVVELGNNFATSESEIVAMTNRLAAGGTLAGLTTTDILGLATAMSSVGITAEAGGTAMTQTLTAIEKAFANFSAGAESDLPRIAEIAGMSAEDFAEAWKTAPIEAVRSFISGLGDLDDKGENAVLVLDELGMAGIRQSNMLKSLALASETLGNAVDTANQAYIDNTALTDEATKRYETFAAQTSQLKEAFKMFASAIGSTITDMLMPAIEGLTSFFAIMSTWWNGMSEPMQKFIVIIGSVMAAVGPLLLLGGKFLIFAGQISAAVAVLGGWSTVLAPLTGVIATITASLSAFAPVIAVVAGIAAAVALFAHEAEKMGITWEDVKEGLLVVWETAKEAWGIFIDAIGKGVKDIGQFLNDMIMFYWNSFKAIFDFLGQKADDAMAWAIEFIRNMSNGISSTIHTVYDAITNGLSSAWTYIQGIASSAWSWGSDIVSNLANGIASGARWVIDQVSSLASQIWSYLHFSEPEKGPLSNFNTWMPDMMKQMAKGINDNAYLVEDAIGNVASRMAIDPQYNSMNYGGVVINLNVPEGTDGAMLVDQIETELANRTMRRRAVFA